MSRPNSPFPIAIGPSVLSADFLRLGEQLTEIEQAGADYIHFDVMDGRFVPNISIGLPVLEATRRGTSLPIDVHLMIVEPGRWVDDFQSAGADSMTFHIEAASHAHRVVESIVGSGMRTGVALNPATPISAIEELIPHIHRVLVMTVNPGFGGQLFVASMPDKIRRLRETIDRVNPECAIQVDGGINSTTIARVVEAGATSIVAGSSVINGEASIARNIAALRAAISSQVSTVDASELR